MAIEEELGKTYRAYYCHNGNLICARYIVCQKLGKPAVPPDLYPDQWDRAREIIAAGMRSVPKPDPSQVWRCRLNKAIQSRVPLRIIISFICRSIFCVSYIRVSLIKGSVALRVAKSPCKGASRQPTASCGVPRRHNTSDRPEAIYHAVPKVGMDRECHWVFRVWQAGIPILPTKFPHGFLSAKLAAIRHIAV